MLSPSTDAPPLAATGLEVRPFRALTYRRRDPEHLARVSSPAYDLVTPAGRENLAAADPHNIVRLILPRVEPAPGEGGPHPVEDRPVAARIAEQAAATLHRWEDEEVLQRDPEPAVWLYELQPADGTGSTRGWLGAVALPAPGSGAVLPHEDTYPRAVEGRRALLAATETDLEPIVLAHDPDPQVAALSAAVRSGNPDLVLTDSDGVRHRLWRVSDPGFLTELGTALRRTGAVIADGHHRFAAAQAHHRERPDSPGSDAVLALVTPMGAGGLRVEGIHRVVPELALDDAVSAAARGFSIEELTLDAPAAGAPATEAAGVLTATAGAWLHQPGASGLLVTDGRRLVRLSSPTDEILATVPREAPAAWRGLDVVLAHHGLVEHLWGRPDDPETLLVAHDVGQALRTAIARNGVAVLLRAPSPADVAAVARAGARMPRKSTLFVPKPRTGLVMRPHGG